MIVTGRRSAASVVAKGLVKRFHGFTAINNVDITIGGSGITALIGANGAGKSTLFNLICGQLRADSGSVVIDGVDVTMVPPHEIARRGIARGFQDVRLFGGMSVLDNVRVYAQPPRSASLLSMVISPVRSSRESAQSRERSLEILDYLNIGTLSNALCGTLSFAEQKLVAIARLLALEPTILMLDEPASGLDPRGRATLTEAIKKLASDGHSVCFVEHNSAMVRELADRVVFLAQGRILADGAPDDVFARSSLAETYLGLS